MKAPQAEKEYARFVHHIFSCDLDTKDKIKVLQHAADECWLYEYNLLYLECKQMLKELRGW